MNRPEQTDPPERPKDLAPWFTGCVVALAAVAGIGGLVLYLAFYLDPPTWAQVLIGIGLPAGGSVLAWLVATALRRSRP